MVRVVRGAGRKSGACQSLAVACLRRAQVEVLKGKISPGKCSVFFAPFLLTQFFSQRTHLSILCDSYLDEFRPPGNCESRITACQSLALRGGGRW